MKNVKIALLRGFAHWAESDYGLSAGQRAVLPEGKDQPFLGGQRSRLNVSEI